MKKNNKGFTLAELLIVVAIIAVLTAIAIPVFTTQLEKSREATDQANVRSAYANVMAQYLGDADSGYSMEVTARQTQSGWQGPSGTIVTMVGPSSGTATEGSIHYNAKTKGSKYNVKITKSGTVTIE